MDKLEFVLRRNTRKVKRPEPTSWAVNLEEGSGENKRVVFKYPISQLEDAIIMCLKANAPYNPLLSNNPSGPGCSCNTVVIASFLLSHGNCYPGGVPGQLQPSTFQEPGHLRTMRGRNVSPRS